MKIDRRKNYYLVIDTETCNSVEEPLPYDIGYAICDKKGNIYIKRSFIVAETFLDMKDVMQSAYYAEKIPTYWEDIKSGKRIIKTFWNIRRQMLEDMVMFNVNTVCAYNMGFDMRALNNLIRYVSKSWKRYFFPYNTNFICIWDMACTTILNTKSYINFALQNSLVSEKNNILTSAESAYKFLTQNLEFKENHTGLEDVEIEIEIMAKCFSVHKKMDKSIKSWCWRIPQNKRKELGL